MKELKAVQRGREDKEAEPEAVDVAYMLWGGVGWISHAQTLRRLSQEPVQRAMPSGLTSRQETLLSWP